LILWFFSYKIEVKMGMARQLYQLQVIEIDIESKEQALAKCLSQLGESRVVAEAKARLLSAQERLEKLKHEQHSAEWEIEDLETKLSAAKDSLYSGRIKNPKELSSLQHEVEGLNAIHDQMEEKVLEIMEQVELATADSDSLRNKLKALEEEWRVEQQGLSAEIEQLKSSLLELKNERQMALDGIDAETVDGYNRLRKQKGLAVARVEQGTCCGCRISLSTAELQRARGGSLVKCNSCGRILFID
jgi:predicted  nucleic acid-binding Zn-ribbon protein